MNILAFASAWTFGDLTACRREVSSGVFDGIEGPPPSSLAEARRYGQRLAQDGIPFIAEVCTGGAYAPASSVTFETHLAEFREQAERGADASPLFLNCLVGSDSWPATKAIDFLGRALEIGQRLGAVSRYKPLMKGTHILTLSAAQKAFVKAPGLMSVFGSSKVADDFNVKNAVYKVSQDPDLYLDPTLTTKAMN